LLRSRPQFLTGQASQERLTESLDRITKSQERRDAAHQRLTESLDRLPESQKRTDERLNALIQIVDDLVRRK
jgi:hypothetical protein